MVTCRKPLPLTARSSWLPDCCRLPCVNERLVDTLAMLLEITSSCVCWACMPVLEIHRELIMVCSGSGERWSSVQAQQLARGLVVGLAVLQHAHLHFELARHGDHSHHGLDRVHVAAFDCVLLPFSPCVGRPGR